MDTIKAEEYNREIPKSGDPLVAIAERRRFRRFIKPVADRIASTYVKTHDLPAYLEQGFSALQTTRFVQAYNHLLRKKVQFN